MKALFTGRGGNGSWEVRGNQLGAAVGSVKINATLDECRQADVIVVVKRIPPQLLAAIRSSGRPWAYDIVDAYPQPECANWTKPQTIRWAKEQVRALNPSGVIWPTRRMMEDCCDGRPGIALPHHHRPGIESNPIREKVRTVGYEGREAYLGGWRALIDRECMRRGWSFVANPRSLADLDIVVAVRSEQWDSYASRHWKSNVKLANAHGSGTPFVGNSEFGYLETAAGGERWADNGNRLADALDELTSHSVRSQVAEQFRQRAYPLASAASDLSRFLQTLC